MERKALFFGVRSLCFLLGLVFSQVYVLHAQRVSIGIGLNGGAVYVPTTMRTILAQSISGNLFIDSLIRPGSHAPLFGLSVSLHARLFQINQEQSVGLAAQPMFGFYIPQPSTDGMRRQAVTDTYGGPLILHLPVMLQFTRGMFSTLESVKDYGWGIGLGMEASWLRDGWQTAAKENNPFNYAYNLAPNFLIRPVGALYWRYWTQRNVPVEWALQFSSTEQTYALGTIRRPMIRLGFTGYLNY